MHKGLLGFVLTGLLGTEMAGCSRDAGTPDQRTTPAAQRDQIPQYWRDAQTHFKFAGGRANLTLIAHYIAEGMQRRLGPDSVWSMYGGMRLSTHVNVVTLGEGGVDFAMATPPINAKMALEGKGFFEKPYPNLRAIAVFPQNDWLGCAARADLGVSSFDEVKARQIPLKIATDRRSTGVGFLVERLLEAYGISREDLETWGGQIIPAPGPSGQSVEKVLSGEANAICHEGWKSFYSLTEKLPMKFLSVNDDVLNRLNQEYGYQRNVIEKGLYQPNVPDRDIPVVDFSDWVVLAHSNVPEELAYLAAQVAVEDRADFEILFMGEPPDERDADLPLQPEIMWKNVGVPLHPGAERYYREAGYMP